MRKYPNIIMIILDAARQDMFGCYGNTEGLTPNIDALAQEGVVLKNHYAAGCGSAQAHVSIFSGQHSERHRMVHNFCDINDKIEAIPLLLKQCGYQTFGHVKVSICPPAAGYGELFGFDEMIYPDASKGNGEQSHQGLYKGLALSLRRFMVNTAKKILSQKILMRINANMYDGRASLKYLLRKLRENKGKDAVFVYSTLLHPHLPYLPPQKFIDQVFKGRKVNKLAYRLQYQHHAYANGDFGDATEAIESIRQLYKGEVLYVDHLIGNFVSRLKKEGLFDNTILLIMSDHGEYLGEHQLLTHGNMVWEELFNIPCIIRYPEKISAGTTVKHMTSGLDILPTIMGLISRKDVIKDTESLDGKDIFEKEDDWGNRYLVVDSPPAVLPERLKAYPKLLYASTMIYRAVRTKEYKYIWQSNGKEYLFHAGSDESDEQNIIEANRNIATDLKEKMIDFYKNINPGFKIDEYPVVFGKNAAKFVKNPVIRNELKKLGYL